ncbi:hypothetical protein ATCC90586_003559 [Pythium insidiosum]|nr:hypothetical protein ATCC90586_003559 [Pythium insidiosum]
MLSHTDADESDESDGVAESGGDEDEQADEADRQDFGVGNIADDVNVVGHGEDARQMNGLASDDDSDGIDEGSDNEVQEEAVEDGDENCPKAEVADKHFYDSFVDAVGGEEVIARGAVAKAVFDSMAVSGWSNPVLPDVEEYMDGPYGVPDASQDYPGLFSGSYGPTREALAAADTPLGAFLFFMPAALWKHVAISSNETRVYMRNKPHKWGTKLFMMCCATSAYCIRLEVYCGKEQTSGVIDTKSGPAAVVRNVKAVFGDEATKANHKRLIVTDRFYTSVALALQLLTLGFYTVGTIMTNRVGFPKTIIDKRKSRPPQDTRGSYKYAESLHVPSMKAVCWQDNKPVHLLTTGGSTELDRVVRRQPRGEQIEVPCPRVLKDYQKYMGGVDVHDQLRLQRYSLQRALKFQKYYKSLFLGLADIAEQVDEWRPGNTPATQKRRTRACKVCSVLKTDNKRSSETSWRCKTCRYNNLPVYLCQRARREYRGQRQTCFDIWHDTWKNGTDIPKTTKRSKIRARKTTAEVETE